MAGLEPAIVEAARRVNPHELLGLVRHVTDAIDGDGGAAADEAIFARRRHHMSHTIDGMMAVDGLYDPESGLVHEAAINAQLEREYFDGDTRTPVQRRADAVTAIFRQSLDHGVLGNSRAVRPHVTIVIDLDQLPGVTPPLAAQIRVERRHAGGLSPATLERITCDCDVSRVITGGRSEILDVGRATRTISSALWKALVVRDRHCRAPGCDQPPERCEAHHIQHWSRGGPTSLENLELLCRHHHRHRHRHQADAHENARAA